MKRRSHVSGPVRTHDDEQEARIGAEARATYAEARIRELEEENQRLRGG